MLTHQVSVVKNPPNRNLGREVEYSDDDEDETATSGGGNLERGESPAAASRTLFDIIQDEESSAAFAYSGVFGGGRSSNKLNWRSFKDNVCKRRTGHACNSPRGGSADDFEGPSSPRPAAAASRTRSMARNESRVGGSELDLHHEEEEREVEPGTVSLMSLLEQEDDEEEEEEDEEEEGEGEGGEEEEEHVCCVCMVRHKGAAFIPCGHTFCRLCSRELWASRGNCPLCNGYILEILNIF